MAYGTVNADVIQSSVTGVSLGAGNATSFKNRMINGGMQVAQRGTSFTSVSTSTFCVDRTYLTVYSAGIWTLTQDTDVPAGYGFANSFKAVCTSANASPNQLRICQSIEGYNVSDSNYGTATARPYTLSFWIKTNKTGTYSASFETATSGRYYTTNFTVSASATWEFKTIVIPGDTSGTLNTTNGVGLTLSIWVGAGSSLTGSGTQNAWTTNATYSNIAQGQTVQLSDTVSNYFNITGLQFEVGSSATGFDFRSYGTELALCQRYLIKFTGNDAYGGYGGYGGGYTISTTRIAIFLNLPVAMRSVPTLTKSGANRLIYASGGGMSTVTDGSFGNSQMTLQNGYFTVDAASGTPFTGGTVAAFSANTDLTASLSFTAEL